MKKKFLFIMVIIFILFNLTINIKAYEQPKTVEDLQLFSETQKTSKKTVKKVYLTFDDGPSINTLRILDILNNNNVRGTFFVIGERARYRQDVIKKLNRSGMCIGVHCYTHNYKNIYSSVSTYFEDLNNCSKIIKNITGKAPISYIRIPGGSDNLVSGKTKMSDITKAIKASGLKYVDWNVSSLDASGENIPKDKIVKNVINECKNNNHVVILMHDSPAKKSTVEALPEIVNYLKREGYVFKTFENITYEEEKILIKKRVINR